jgi:hypothetical protein
MAAPRQRSQICRWAGPNPLAGEYVRTSIAGGHWLILSVSILSTGELALRLRALPTGARPPDTAILHPYARLAPYDRLGPERVRQVATSGHNAVMAARWRDPSDERPGVARMQKQVSGYRVMDPLRMMLARRHRLITPAHVAAADCFRRDVDEAQLGLTPARDLEGMGGGTAGPRFGHSEAAVRQAYADMLVRRIFDSLHDDQVRVLYAVTILGLSMSRWCTMRSPKRNEDRQYDLLKEALDVVEDFYRFEVQVAMATEHMVTAV